MERKNENSDQLKKAKMPVVLFFVVSCLALGLGCETPGCTDDMALNFDFSANKNDGSCSYSSATFYARFQAFNGIPIRAIDVDVNGEYIGTITSVYPGGPGNCNANGTVAYSFNSGQSIDWNTTVHLAIGGPILNSGTLSPSPSQNCISVNVTR